MINVDKFVASLMRHYYDTYNVDKRVYKCWLDDVLEDQGLEYKNGEIIKNQRRVAAEAKEALYTAEVDSEDEKKGSNKKEWLFEKGKWYVKLQHHYEGDLRHFEKGHAYKAVSEVKITDGYHSISLSAWQIPKYFRPANQDEIPEELEQKTKLDENEEIRNYFIDAVNEQVAIYPEWKEKCLKWLKKQESVREIVERCKNSWYNEGKIAGMAEGLTNDEKYQQGWHDALEKQGNQKPLYINTPLINKMVNES